MTKAEFVETASELVEFHFPKGKAGERGQAMVLVAELAIELLNQGAIDE